MSELYTFDAELAQTFENLYMTETALARRRHSLKLLNAKPDASVLDLGCGPGFFAIETAESLGQAGTVCALDSSPSMLAMAKARAEGTAAESKIQFREGDALNLPFPENHFDAVAVLQVYEYISDVPAALQELHRVIKPGGRYLVLDTNWSSMVMHSEDPQLTERILKVFEGHLADPNLPRTLGPALKSAGLSVEKIEPFVNFAVGEHDAFTKAVEKLIADFAKGKEGLTDDQVDGWAAELESLAASGRAFMSWTQFFFCGTKAP